MKQLAVLLFFVSSSAFAMAMPNNLPPMPLHCTTPKTMDIWYMEVAKQNLAKHHSSTDCKNELLKLGAISNVTKFDCK